MKKPIVIFGASILGEVVLEDIKPVCFVDNDIEKQKKLFHGYRVISFKKLLSKYPKATIIIAAGRYYDDIYDQVVPYYPNIYRVSPSHPEGVSLNQLNVVVTERCTLRCIHCSSSMPRYKKPKDCDTRILLTSLGYILDSVDAICRVEILGGEPFLNVDLPKIIAYLWEYIPKIEIITNGTILPKPHVLKSLKHWNVSVIINDYGEVSKKMDILFNSLANQGVTCKRNRHWSWANLGGFDKRGRCSNELKDLFSRCNFNTCTELLHGKLYRCPRSSHGTNLGIIPNFTKDYINVYDTDSIKTLKSQIKRLFKKEYLQACDYCDGNTRQTLILEPAIQKRGK